ncbi:hypothetical protein VNI00_014226 [Paramarasmius palmivorus]|uniref:Uncharacterized protein n=1 Tax=Paramarasmius palmivorus TaxID=297713 RepID=A0AAW0BWJ7_9AGAR
MLTSIISPTSHSQNTSEASPCGATPCNPLASASDPENKRSQSHSKVQSKANRRKQRAAAKAQKTPETYAPPPSKKARTQEIVNLDVTMDQLRASDNGFTGYHSEYGSQRYSLEDMVGDRSKFKFQKLEWDGRCDMVLVTKEGYQITHCIGSADTQSWPIAAQRAADKLDSAKPRFTGKLLRNRRGDFDALSAGISCDQGMTEPRVVGQANATNATIVADLLRDPDVTRLAGYQSSMFYHCQPTLYEQYASNRIKLKEKIPSLFWNFANSIFAHVTFNFGPQTVCVQHTDFGNHADGFCAITALSPAVGGYDYKKGGHLILWDLRLVIEFPPGTTILLLSAVLRHSNVAIGETERRFSFTQYTAGSLFRWVERGFRLEKDFWASLTSNEVKAEKAKDKSRWRSAFVNFTKYA